MNTYAIIFFVIAALWLGYGVYVLLRSGKKKKYNTATQATIKKREAYGHGRGKSYILTVEHFVNGYAHTAELDAKRVKESTELGKKINVVYDPEDPDKVYIPKKVGTAYFFVTGLIFLGLAILNLVA